MKQSTKWYVMPFVWIGNKQNFLINVLRLPESLVFLPDYGPAKGEEQMTRLHSRTHGQFSCTKCVEEAFVAVCIIQISFLLSIPKRKNKCRCFKA
jgi:hypothetical protein